jgi:hypothetical protein
MSEPALAGGDDYMCRNGLFPSDNQVVALMRATGKPRTYLLWDRDTKGCPSETKACRSAYVLPGQEVLAGKHLGNFICAFFPNNVGGSAGWVSAGNLTPSPQQPDPNPPLRSWLGNWRDGLNWLDISLVGNELKVSGHAFWVGPAGPASLHDGGIDAQAKPRKTSAEFAEEDCRVWATLFGKYLLISDNENCGGVNVRFDGVYRRGSKP